MENTVSTIIIAAVVILLIFVGLRFKQKKQAEMNADFYAMAERGDLDGVSHFFLKQLYWWVPLTVVMLIIWGYMVFEGRSVSKLLFSFVAVAFPAYRVFLLAKSWLEVEKMKKEACEPVETVSEADRPEVLLQEIVDFFGDECEVSPLEVGDGEQELTQAYLKAKAEGERGGFFPVILQLDNNLIENLNEERASSSTECALEGAQVLRLRMQDLKEGFNDETEWNEFLGDDTNADGGPLVDIDNSAYLNWERFVMVKVPVARASEIFVKIPMGNWNDCPSAAEHQAIAQYWNDRYGAVPCFIASDIVMYHVPKPVGSRGVFELALDQTAYAPDIVMQGHEDVWSLAKQLEHASFWYFWWD